jgi:hypothetical protein
MYRRRRPGRVLAIRVPIALIAIGALLGSALAYAQTRTEGRGAHGGPGRKAAKKPRFRPPPRPQLIEVPDGDAIGPSAQFRFRVAPREGEAAGAPSEGSEPAAPVPRPRRFECRLDGGDWERCASPRRLADLQPGDHSFAVRALDRRGRSGPAARHAWAQPAPQRFTVESLGAPPAELMPGAPAQPLPVRIANPNPVPIEVTSLTVAIATDPPGCPSDPNFELIPAGVSPSAPLSVPPGGSVSLPAAATAPAIALRELPRDQNACQGAALPLVFRGEAHG